MPKFGQLVMGPAGSGKTTYCKSISNHCRISRIDHRHIKLVNLDPGLVDFVDLNNTDPSTQRHEENLTYDIDIRDLISVHDVMEEYSDNIAPDQTDLDKYPSSNEHADIIGPNGALVYCMEYLAKDNFLWLEEKFLENLIDGDYVLFDCPGQIELYTHIPVIKRLVDFLIDRADFRICGVFLVDSVHFLVDINKYFSVTLTSLSVMINMERISFVNIFSKMDLMTSKCTTKILPLNNEKMMDGSNDDSDTDDECFTNQDVITQLSEPSIELHDHFSDSSPITLPPKYLKLTRVLASVINSYDLIKFHPLNINKKNSIENIMYHIDLSLQYDEEREPKEIIFTGAESEINDDKSYDRLDEENQFSHQENEMFYGID
ncbi:unnamed protein product [Gordionus sp. m RMFG-2023]|uniref:GPN-loop GTPase 3-like n=1 Tax=Gordionus sp. m RMFG-2023 TaxID=3053472 RepID=UPI0030E36A0A